MKYSLKSTIKNYNEEIDQSFIFFWGHHPKSAASIDASSLSQWFIRDFNVDPGNHTYNCMEKYMMAHKAITFHDLIILEKILSSQDPKEIKALGREVKNFDSKIWDERKYNIVVEGNRFKFGSNPDLAKFLLSTGDKIIVESSPYDKIWGIGLENNTKNETLIENPNNWKGENLLGFALMEVRDYLNKVKI